MLKQLILENWKSFRYAELPLDPLTVLIGTNASGKSNIVEALEFLQRIARGENIEVALAGDKTLPSIRGGVEWAAIKPETEFTLKALVQGEDDKTDYFYTITLQTIPVVRILKECINIDEYHNKNSPNQKLFIINVDDKTAKSHLSNYGGFSVDISPLFEDISFKEFNEVIKEETKQKIRYEIRQKMEFAQNNLDFLINHVILPIIKNILILNPIPSKMRDYSRLSDTLEGDASNIAGVLAGLTEEQKAEVELTLSEYIKDFPEGDIQKVWAEKVGRFGTDAMLYCQEEWKPGHITEIDARTMSDGTLQFIAIITALLTRPEGSQLVIEEIDNGLHPSRAELLVRILREIGSKRKIDILLTTHNPALLDALGPEIVPFVVVAHRDSETGESKLTLLEDIENLPLLLASGTLGKLATKGAIEKSLSDNK
ncbi:ATPase [Nostoc sp. 'Peltigera membranacea cyanobiont' 210A]|uniref:AAA family ATPase n=1 Tax=Nostoc sp. 'Peltigera membranacea cyanobiont' 210A TaxID=2014529 RepID=UPI000B953721|nr:ATP-binding protein [Nostoc sp. 'Peltigera membranacea cyanobiont' 210A]OYD92072.1 ATPase [Nostoc sp. 'Peltigera membranacea cyanobiont' 210A]